MPSTALDQREAKLGKVIEFSRQGRPVKARPEAGAVGQLLMFTGVRYERAVTVTQAGPRTPQPANPRRTQG